ncbi:MULTISPECIES: helix-turn-helix transcriptional regulator [Paenibacillus]|uniref:Helix-turn-helix domain-containing protein n=1 Tax=Paenibacillus campinasensis TaxID=66347 RepID=A0A268F1Q3_9BACL|nr:MULTISPECIES: helix-turn-helix transcriptional regulator [Paenibacillus]MUG65688.1 helix-turn-helix domain-containing protein [Paenibacillus campinasensis]PAD79274.1 transcriptional regulator [Paenibacillus campinasensis]PAK54268.1 transcriptional regulator [Paenibacillus sp. 7541]
MLKNRVRELRARFQFTQGELAKRVGVTRQTIAFIEKGEFAPSVTLALKITKEFECTVEEVFWLEEEE